MTKFGEIQLAWRKGKGHKRHLVGVIKHNKTNGVTFSYLSTAELKPAKEDGFKSYTEFSDLSKIYREGVLDIFKQRLFKSEREDYQEFLDFWDIEQKYKEDTLYLLAHTQGLTPTDHFEFLAKFNITKDLMFVSEIAGLSYSKISSELLSEGDEIVWKKAKSDYDCFQVDLFKDNVFLGHVKKVHSEIFYKNRSNNLKVRVKALDKNGVIKRAFIEINCC